MNERKAEPKPDVLERGKEYLRLADACAGENTKAEILLADAIAEIKRLGRAHEVVVAAYNLAHQEVETLQSRLHTEAKPMGYVVERIFGPDDFHPICWAHTLEEAERLKQRQMRQNQRGESSYRIQAVVAPKAESDGA